MSLDILRRAGNKFISEQQSPKRGFKVDDLANLIQSVSSPGQLPAGKQVNSLAELNNYIDSANDINSITNAYNTTNNLESISNSPTDIAILNGTKNNLINKAQNLQNYQASLDNASEMANKFIDYRIDDYKNMSLEDVMMELRSITDFNSYVYKTPDKKEFNNFVGYQNSGGMNDKQVINRINEYERTLNTMVEAFSNDGKVTDNEIFFILTGDEKRFQTAKTDNIKRLEKNIGGRIKSINSIKNHQKKLLDAVTRSGLKPGAVAVDFTRLDDEGNEAKDDLEETIVADAVQTPGSLFENMDFNEAMSKMNELTGNMNYQEVLQLYSNEIANIQSAIEIENDEYKLWSGVDFASGIDSPAKDDIVKRELGKALESYTEELSPREMLRSKQQIISDSLRRDEARDASDDIEPETFDVDVVDTMVEDMKPDRESIEIENDPETFDVDIKVEDTKMANLGDASFKDIADTQGLKNAIEKTIPKKSPVRKLFNKDGGKLKPNDLTNMSVTQLRKTLRKAQGDVRVKGFKTREQSQLINKIVKDAAFIQKNKNNKDASKEIEFIKKRMHKLYEQLTDDFLKNIKL